MFEYKRFHVGEGLIETVCHYLGGVINLVNSSASEEEGSENESAFLDPMTIVKARWRMCRINYKKTNECLLDDIWERFEGSSYEEKACAQSRRGWPQGRRLFEIQ